MPRPARAPSLVALAAILAVGCAYGRAEATPTLAHVASEVRGSDVVPTIASSSLTSAGEESPSEQGEVEVAKGEADEAPRAWLYRVTDRDGAQVSYLLGTLHVGVAFTRALPAPLDRTMLDARVVVMEIDLREAQRYLARPVRFPRRARVRVDEALPRESWTRLTTELAFIASAQQIAQVPPGMLAIYLRQVRMAEVEATDDGWSRIPGTASPTHLDRWIYDWAMQWSVPFVALETPEETVAALSGVQRRDPIQALRAMIDDPERARAEARRLRDAYLSLDEARITEVLAAMSEDERRATFAVRNRAWMERLVPELERGDAFVAVGLAHLVGDESLVAMLRERGFVVERVEGDGAIPPRPASEGWSWSRALRRATEVNDDVDTASQ